MELGQALYERHKQDDAFEHLVAFDIHVTTSTIIVDLVLVPDKGLAVTQVQKGKL